jgi:hypothetical protein
MRHRITPVLACGSVGPGGHRRRRRLADEMIELASAMTGSGQSRLIDHVRDMSAYPPTPAELRIAATCTEVPGAVISRHLFDDLVGAGRPHRRNVETERLGSVEIRTNLNLVACSTGMSPGFAPSLLKNVFGVGTRRRMKKY